MIFFFSFQVDWSQMSLVPHLFGVFGLKNNHFVIAHSDSRKETGN